VAVAVASLIAVAVASLIAVAVTFGLVALGFGLGLVTLGFGHLVAVGLAAGIGVAFDFDWIAPAAGHRERTNGHETEQWSPTHGGHISKAASWRRPIDDAHRWAWSSTSVDDEATNPTAVDVVTRELAEQSLTG